MALKHFSIRLPEERLAALARRAQRHGRSVNEQLRLELEAGENWLRLERLLELAGKLPSGAVDPESAKKLLREWAEFEHELSRSAATDHSELLTELADVVYYAVKAMYTAAAFAGEDLATAMRVAVAKYRLRAESGNPKRRTAEQLAVVRAKYEEVSDD